MKQVMTEWQWGQPKYANHLHLAADNHTSTLSLNFLKGWMLNNVKAVKAKLMEKLLQLHYIRLMAFFQDNLGKPAPER